MICARGFFAGKNYAHWGKPLLDRAAAAGLLVLLAPVLGVVALLVRRELGRPVLFRQTRAGRHGVAFTLLKLRSMAEGDGPDAARLGTFGRRLRASGLDELPQLVNVLRGEMSLVGPRPLPVPYTALYSARQAQRLRVRPGLAGPGVAAGRNAVDWPHRLELDAAYASAGPSLLGDAALVWGTLRVWLGGAGVSAPEHATMPAFRGETLPMQHTHD